MTTEYVENISIGESYLGSAVGRSEVLHIIMMNIALLVVSIIMSIVNEHDVGSLQNNSTCLK